MLTIASYNIRKAIGTDRRRRPERILEVLQELDADIVALQECDRRFGERRSAIPTEMIEEWTSYAPVEFQTRPHSLGWHGNALLVRKSLRIAGSRILHLPTVEPRGAVMAQVEAHERQLVVAGVHLDLSGLRRRQQVRSVLHQIELNAPTQPTVIMGDFNQWTVRGSLAEVDGHFHVAATGPSYHARRPVASLDRILVNDRIEILEAGAHSTSLSRAASDHLPVWARIALR